MKADCSFSCSGPGINVKSGKYVFVRYYNDTNRLLYDEMLLFRRSKPCCPKWRGVVNTGVDDMGLGTMIYNRRLVVMAGSAVIVSIWLHAMAKRGYER